MENKQLKSEDFIGKWVTSDLWENDSYCLVKSIDEAFPGINTWYSKSFLRTTKYTNDRWVINSLSDLKIVSEAEVAKKAIGYVHDLRELGLHQFISVNKITKEDLYNTKIWIGNDESLSRKIQERLFELGFEWWGKGKKCIKNITSIYLNPDNEIGHMKCESKDAYFTFNKFKEITVSDLGLKETVIDCDESIYNQPIEIIPVIKTTDINIPNIILTNNKLTI